MAEPRLKFVPGICCEEVYIFENDTHNLGRIELELLLLLQEQQQYQHELQMLTPCILLLVGCNWNSNYCITLLSLLEWSTHHQAYLQWGYCCGSWGLLLRWAGLQGRVGVGERASGQAVAQLTSFCSIAPHFGKQLLGPLRRCGSGFVILRVEIWLGC